jgi:pimeloyl-ACP methyl ester carboxylesterase
MKRNVANDPLNQQITLRDGRRLGFAELGDLTGRPLFYCHGWPGSRVEACALSDVCAGMGVRVIAPDRPGCGLSDFKSRRTIPNWADDLCELADHLGLDAFAVLGISGGGPYAAACAERFPERVLTAALVCSMAPLGAAGITRGMALPHRCLLHFAQSFPVLARILAAPCLCAIWGRGEQAIPRHIEERLPKPDRQTLASSRLRTILASSSRESFRNGPRGPAWDGLLYARPWGFRVQDIRIPVAVWHGERDIIVPATMGHYLAGALRQCRARFLPEDGHFSLPFNHLREILASMPR